jgi:putative hydrolase of the HAD superfamily
MQVSFLADNPQYSETIAKWYFDEWGQLSSDFTQEKVLKSVLDKSTSRTELPLIIILLSMNNELLGVAELKLRENINHPEYEHWVGGVFIAPPQRGKGYASLLLSAIKQRAIELDLDQLYLQCDKHHIDLYLKNDFQILHDSTHHGMTTTIMCCKLNN